MFSVGGRYVRAFKLVVGIFQAGPVHGCRDRAWYLRALIHGRGPCLLWTMPGVDRPGNRSNDNHRSDHPTIHQPAACKDLSATALSTFTVQRWAVLLVGSKYVLPSEPTQLSAVPILWTSTLQSLWHPDLEMPLLRQPAFWGVLDLSKVRAEQLKYIRNFGFPLFQ